MSAWGTFWTYLLDPQEALLFSECFKVKKYSSSLSLSLTFHHHHTTTSKFLRTLELTYTQVWYIIGIISSSPTHFHSEKIGLIRVTYDPLSVLGLINILVTYTQVWYIIGIVSSCPADLHSEKIGLIRVTHDPLSVLGLINI